MIHNCYIDGVDCRTDYGVWIKRGGYNQLFSFPALKVPDFNDWPEDNGLEADLNDPRLQPLTINVDFVASGASADPSGFVEMLSAPGYHVLNIPSLGRSWNVRLNEGAAFTAYRGLSDFALSFIIDIVYRPEAVTSWLDPNVRIVQSYYSLDGINLSNYGIFVSEGKANVLKTPAVKDNLTRNISVIDGQIYDADVLYFKSKDVSFKCHLKATSIDKLWSCYDAFFANLVQPNARTLHAEYTGLDYSCYYSSMSAPALEALSNGFCMIGFDLTLTFI